MTDMSTESTAQESGPSLRDFLAQRDVACPGCGYNLRGLTGPRCPECHQALSLQVGLVEPRMRAYLAAVIGLACGVGFSGLLLVFVAISELRSRGGGPLKDILLFTVVPLLMQGVCLLLLLRSRVWFRAISNQGRAGIIAGCWALTLVNILAFSMFVD